MTAHASTSTTDLTTWHRRLGQLHADAVSLLQAEGMATGMEITKGSTPATPCDPCLKRNKPAQKSEKNNGHVVLGRMTAHEIVDYFVTWVDDKSRKVFVDIDCLNTRGKCRSGNRATRVSVVFLRSDGGCEYIASELQQFLKNKGTKHEITTPDAPQHNSVAERMNRTLLDRVRAMLVDAQLSETYLYDALRYAAHIHNVTPTRALDGITPG